MKFLQYSLYPHFKRFALFLLIFCPFFCGCATKSPSVALQQQEASESPQKITEPQTPSGTTIEAVEVIDLQDHYRVKITSTEPPTYAVFKLSNPERIIIDMPEMLMGEDADIEEIQNELISSITSSQVEETGKSFTRIAIDLKQDISYNATQEGSSLFIDIAKPQTVDANQASQKTKTQESGAISSQQKEEKTTAVSGKVAAQPSDKKNSIVNLETSQTSNGYQITVITDHEISNYFSQILQNPNRLAIDIPKATSKLAKTVFPVESPLIDKVRLGENANNVRFVLDFAGPELPLYQIAQKGNALSINVSTPAKNMSAATEQSGTETEKESTEAALLPVTKTDTQEEGTVEYTGHRISLDFKDADIKNVLRLFADISGLNIIVSDNVQGQVTVKLDNIPWDEALDLVLETNNLGKIVTRNIVRIETMEQIKRINAEKLEAKKSQEKLEDLIIKTVDISYAKATKLVNFIKKMKGLLSERGSINSFELTNKITIQDIPDNVEQIVAMIKEQDIPTRQVLIESSIVQSNPSYVKELGIQWGGFYNTTRKGGAAAGSGGADIDLSGAAGGGNVVNLPAPVGPGSGGGINFGYITDSISLDIQLTALENDEKIKIVSNPKVLALDNEEARIKQGVALPYLKLSEEGVTSTEFKDAVLELEVTPHITPANTIKLHIYVTKNQRSSQTGGGGEPGIDVRELETDLLVESGKTIVIGGIYETTQNRSVKKVPFFGDLPYAGRFFRNERTEDQLIELLVFLTVTVVEKPGLIAQVD